MQPEPRDALGLSAEPHCDSPRLHQGSESMRRAAALVLARLRLHRFTAFLCWERQRGWKCVLEGQGGARNRRVERGWWL